MRREERIEAFYSLFFFSGADVPEGERNREFFAAVLVGHGDDFADCQVLVAIWPGLLDLRVVAGPDFGFVVGDVGDEVGPGCGGGEGFDYDGCDGSKVFVLDVAEVGAEVAVVIVGEGLLVVHSW